jgi:hypothetical protein
MKQFQKAGAQQLVTMLTLIKVTHGRVGKCEAQIAVQTDDQLGLAFHNFTVALLCGVQFKQCILVVSQVMADTHINSASRCIGTSYRQVHWESGPVTPETLYIPANTHDLGVPGVVIVLHIAIMMGRELVRHQA